MIWQPAEYIPTSGGGAGVKMNAEFSNLGQDDSSLLVEAMNVKLFGLNKCRVFFRTVMSQLKFVNAFH